MQWKRSGYLAHRWLGLVVGVQLLAWSVSGFTFTILDIDNVHGDFERNTDPPLPVRVDLAVVSPAEALAALADSGIPGDSVTHISLRERFGQTVYELFDAGRHPLGAVDAVSGEFIARISQDQARMAAQADFLPQAAILSIELLEGEPPSEFRGGVMPVYRIIFDHPKKPHLYISPVTGKVLTRRNKPWRTFDFFWMLHIMDYRQRDNFNHWLLTAMSAIAIVTSASGLVLWLWRLPRSQRSGLN